MELHLALFILLCGIILFVLAWEKKRINNIILFFYLFKFTRIEQILFDLTLFLQAELSSFYLSTIWLLGHYMVHRYHVYTRVLNLRNCYTSQILSRRTFPGKLKHHFHHSETAVDLSLEICVSRVSRAFYFCEVHFIRAHDLFLLPSW